jgi:glycosyltransferase involved in cell wall biosynthesis
MRVLVHDYSGHPFQIQLSRELAGRGHDVLHQHFPDFQTPKAHMRRLDCDPPSFAVKAIELGEPFAKFSFVRRQRQEVAYGLLSAGRLKIFRPDVVLCSNIPLDPLRIVQLAARDMGARFYVWLQDMYSVGMARILPRMLPIIGRAIAYRYQLLERRILREADGVVPITADFMQQLSAWGVPASRCNVVENWAPIDEIRPAPPANGWAARHGLIGKRVVLYSGTLSLKHDPSLIADLCKRHHADKDIAFVVISEGPGAIWLAERKRAWGLNNLRLLPFQPYETFPEALGAASILLAIIEADAGIYSVPSKVLSYLCAGRPILLSVPRENLVARLVLRADAGRVVSPDDREGLGQALAHLLENPYERERIGQNARRFAEREFDIGRIADRFEALLGLTTAKTRLAA